MMKRVVCLLRGHDYKDVVDNYPFKLHAGTDDEMDPTLYIFRAVCRRCGGDTCIVGPGPIWHAPWNHTGHWSEVDVFLWRALKPDDITLMIRRIRTLEFGHADSQYDSPTPLRPPENQQRE